MTPNQIALYEELVHNTNSELPEQWETFKLSAEYDDAGLGLSLEFTNEQGAIIEFSPVPDSVFDVMEKILEDSRQIAVWSKWIFRYNRDGKFDVNLSYPEA